MKSKTETPHGPEVRVLSGTEQMAASSVQRPNSERAIHVMHLQNGADWLVLR